MAILELKDLHYSYNREKEVIKGLSATFEQGRMYAIIGKSGAGKSTLLSLLAGLDVPDNGSVLFNDMDTKNIDRDELRRKKIAVIYQDFSLFPFLTVLENIMYPMKLNNVNPDDALEMAKKLAAKVSLNELLYDHYPSEISGGEQQRVAIARSLSMDRNLLLADEPTGNLDSENSDIIIDTLQKLAHEDNKCIIVVTHDLFVMEKADVVYKLVDGKIYQ